MTAVRSDGLRSETAACDVLVSSPLAAWLREVSGLRASIPSLWCHAHARLSLTWS